VRNLARDSHFGEEARQQVLIFRGGRWQKFKRDRLPQLQIARAIYLAHAASADESNDAVALGEHGAGGETAFIEGVGRNRCAGEWDRVSGYFRCRYHRRAA